MPDLPPHIETIITEACWGVPGMGQLTGEEKLREILEAAWGVLWEWDWDVSVCDDLSAAMENLKEAMSDD